MCLLVSTCMNIVLANDNKGSSFEYEEDEILSDFAEPELKENNILLPSFVGGAILIGTFALYKIKARNQ